MALLARRGTGTPSIACHVWILMSYHQMQKYPDFICFSFFFILKHPQFYQLLAECYSAFSNSNLQENDPICYIRSSPHQNQEEGSF